MHMGLKDWLIGWCLKNIRVPTKRLIELLDEMDSDRDGYIDIPEFVRAVKAGWDYVRKAR